MLEMPSNGDVKAELIFKNVHANSMIFKKKTIWLPAGFESVTSRMQASCSTHWAFCAVVSSFFHFFAFNLLQSANYINSQ